jgi:hypothetical protein
MEVEIIKNWGLSVNIENKMTGKIRTEYFERVKSINGISPLYVSPDGSFYTIGKLGLTNVDKYLSEFVVRNLNY